MNRFKTELKQASELVKGLELELEKAKIELECAEGCAGDQ